MRASACGSLQARVFCACVHARACARAEVVSLFLLLVVPLPSHHPLLNPKHSPCPPSVPLLHPPPPFPSIFSLSLSLQPSAIPLIPPTHTLCVCVCVCVHALVCAAVFFHTTFVFLPPFPISAPYNPLPTPASPTPASLLPTMLSLPLPL
jgi:hypothetical protein